MSCVTSELQHPYQSSVRLDGVDSDREVIQDIAYDGDIALLRRMHGKLCARKRTEMSNRRSQMSRSHL